MKLSKFAIALRATFTPAVGALLILTLSACPFHINLGGSKPGSSDSVNDNPGNNDSVNNTPVLPSPAPGALGAKTISIQTLEDEGLEVSLLALAEDSDPISFEILTQPQYGSLESVDLARGYVRYEPSEDYNGEDGFTYRVKQGTRFSPSAEVRIQVTPVNDSPVAKTLEFNVTEDGRLESQLVASDVDNSSVEYSLVSNASKGTVNLNTATGAFTYEPRDNESGSDSFSYQASDGLLISSEAIVSVSIVAENDAPEAIAVVGSVVVGGLVDIQGHGKDIEGSSLTYFKVAEPTKGTVSVNAVTGVMSYRANVGASGSDTFTYRVFDGQLYSVAAQVSITILAPTLAGVWTATDVRKGSIACDNVNIEIGKADNTLKVFRHGFRCGSSTSYFESIYTYDSQGRIFVGGTQVGSFGAGPLVSIDWTISGFRLRFQIKEAVGGGYTFLEENGSGIYTGSFGKN